MLRNLKRSAIILGLSLPAMMILAGNALALDCPNAQTPQQMKLCTGLEYQKADRELNDTYQWLMNILDDAAKKRLIKAEESWIQYRDTNCAFVGDDPHGGVLERLLTTQCKVRMTQERTKELKFELEQRQD